MEYNHRGSANPLRFSDIEVGSLYIIDGNNTVYVKLSDLAAYNCAVFNENVIKGILDDDLNDRYTNYADEIVRLIRNCELTYDA